MSDTSKVCEVCKKPIEKAKKMEWLTGPDEMHGGDGLPDWMQFTITAGMFGILYWVLSLLFHPILELDPNHRDLLNIILDILRKKISGEHSCFSWTFSIWPNCIFFLSKGYFISTFSIYIS